MWSRFILFNVLFILIIYFFATDDDFKLPQAPFDRLVSVIYFTATILTTTGFGDIFPTSTRSKMFVTIYMMSLFYIVVNQVSIYRPKIPSNF